MHQEKLSEKEETAFLPSASFTPKKSSIKASVNAAPSHAVFCESAGGLVLTDVRDYSRIRKNGPSDELVKLLASRL